MVSVESLRGRKMNAVALYGIKNVPEDVRNFFLKRIIEHLRVEVADIQKDIKNFSSDSEAKKEMDGWLRSYEENLACFEASLVGDELTGNDLIFNFFSLPSMGQFRLKEKMWEALRPFYYDKTDEANQKAVFELWHEIATKCKERK